MEAGQKRAEKSEDVSVIPESPTLAEGEGATAAEFGDAVASLVREDEGRRGRKEVRGEGGGCLWREVSSHAALSLAGAAGA